MNLNNLIVLITGGGGTGVGAGVCKALSGFGAKLLINDIDRKKAEDAAAQYKNSVAFPGDISDETEIERIFHEIKETLGPINGLVNNAGVGLSKTMLEASGAEFDRLYDVNVRAVWLMSKYFVQQLIEAKTTGNIVNISSVHALASQPKYTAYASSKSAVEGFTRALAYEVGGYNIRCNAIAPGMVNAEQNYDLIKTWAPDPEQWAKDYVSNQQVLHHFIQPVDCGNAVAFLLSDLSRSITGQTIYVDAGKTIMLFNRDFIGG